MQKRQDAAYLRQIDLCNHGVDGDHARDVWMCPGPRLPKFAGAVNRQLSGVQRLWR